MNTKLLWLSAAFSALGTPVFADCISNGGTPPVVTCAADDTNGFDDNTDNITVNVDLGVTVSDNKDAIKVEGLNATVNNNGTIDGGDEGIVGSTGLTVTNSGTILAADKGIDADDLDNVTVTNTGTITAGDKAIRIGNGNNAKLTNSGTITSGDEGFEAGDNAIVVNSGTIQATDDAVQVGENGFITNSGIIENIGTDPSNAQDALDIDSGTVINTSSGIIKSTLDAAIDYDGSSIASSITNHGQIIGTTGVLTDSANTAAQIIDNHGLIQGTAGLALDLGAGDDVLRLHSGAQLIGGANFGDDNDTLELLGVFTGAIAAGDLLDGGAGINTVKFAPGLTTLDLASVDISGNTVTLAIKGGGSDYSVSLANWSTYTFGARSYTAQELLAAVPVPASGLLLGLTLLGLGGYRRRSK